ncbi:hypothetical protein DIPPA_27063 [Diplonema papillatum]|nr:hypothetical protein DIPPA_27063 [Diplonema papillatum]
MYVGDPLRLPDDSKKGSGKKGKYPKTAMVPLVKVGSDLHAPLLAGDAAGGADDRAVKTIRVTDLPADVTPREFEGYFLFCHGLQKSMVSTSPPAGWARFDTAAGARAAMHHLNSRHLFDPSTNAKHRLVADIAHNDLQLSPQSKNTESSTLYIGRLPANDPSVERVLDKYLKDIEGYVGHRVVAAGRPFCFVRFDSIGMCNRAWGRIDAAPPGKWPGLSLCYSANEYDPSTGQPAQSTVSPNVGAAAAPQRAPPPLRIPATDTFTPHSHSPTAWDPPLQNHGKRRSTASSGTPNSQGRGNQPCNTMFVQTPDHLTNKDLTRVFSGYPGYCSLSVCRDKKGNQLCFVQFETIQQCEDAMRSSPPGFGDLQFSRNELWKRS